MVEPAQGCKVLLPDSEHMFDDGMAVTGFKSVVGLVTDAIEAVLSPPGNRPPMTGRNSPALESRFMGSTRAVSTPYLKHRQITHEMLSRIRRRVGRTRNRRDVSRGRGRVRQ